MVTIKDVAKKAGVSPATASRVAGNYGYVSQEKRRKVLEAIAQLGYKPDRIAQSMVTKTTRTVGFVVTDIQNPFFAQLARGVEDAIWEHGYALFLANTDENLERENAILTALQEKRVDGLVLVPASSRYSSARNALINQGIPIILLDRASDGLETDTILVDNRQGAYTAVSHLIELGHRRIGMIVDNLDITTNEERIAGYRSALVDHNLTVEENLIKSCQFSQQSAYTLALEMLRRPDRPSALFTAYNLISIGTLIAIHDSGLRIPEDISIVGFDDVEWNQVISPKLTATAQPVYEMGKVAGERLIARLKGDKSPPLEIRLKTRFIVRDSSGPVGKHTPVADNSFA